MGENCKVVRIHLKTGGEEGVVDRKKLMNFCLHNKESQCVAIGWSCAYEGIDFAIDSFRDYYNAVYKWNEKERIKHGGAYRMNAAINRFSETKENDLFWTRDLDGNHWICRAKGIAEPYCDEELDIGAIVPVEAYMYGLEVPGQIAASFSRARGGIAEVIADEIIVVFSQYVFNKLSGRDVYKLSKIGNGDMLDNFPPFDLEELVIAYIQIEENYYVLSNSIANNSTTIKIECEFRSRDIDNPRRAVVQVKGGRSKEIDAEEYISYDNEGYEVYFYAHNVLNSEKLKNCKWITREMLLDFYKKYKKVLPDSITKWEKLFQD